MRIEWRPAAARDYESLREYLDTHSASASEAVARRILASIDSLMQFPQRGRPGRSPGTRELVIPRTPYVVVYGIAGDIIVILRLRHEAQRWPE